MSAPPALEAAVATALGERVASIASVSGGSINDAWRFELGSGATVFVKSRPGAAAAEFEAEAAGLRWLAEAGAATPGVLATCERPALIALEWIEPGSLSQPGAERLGSELASMHRAGSPRFGSLPPGSDDSLLRIGSVELALVETQSWTELYREQLLVPLARMARERGSLSGTDSAAIERVCERLEALAGSVQAPARLHGDLWGGNVLADSDGRPRLIDPAAYGGHREIDLAMLRLFGSPSDRAFAAYDEAYPLADGHEERVELWQLLPLLIHAILFGGSYGPAAGRAARRYL